MLSSISVLICLQIYLLPNDPKYKDACNRAVEAAIVSSGLGQDIERGRQKIEENAKAYFPPALALAPYTAYQLIYKKSVNYHIPHTVVTLVADKNQGQAVFTWSL